jgi:type I restriction enzyme M protein
MSTPNKPNIVIERKSFTNAKIKFDEQYAKSLKLKKSLVPVNGKYIDDISLSSKNGLPSEEYYKWQFIYGLIASGLYSKDFLGVEVYFPKGNKNSAPIKIDGCIFDDKDWITQYEKWRESKDNSAVEWLRKHLISIIEFKKSDDRDIKTVFTSQIKAYIKESEAPYVLGFYYNTERLYIFQKKNGYVLRYDESRNRKGDASSIEDLSLDLTDGYLLIPSFDELIKRINKTTELDRSKRTVDDLDIITGVHSLQINNAISNILRTMDKFNLVDQRGYEILIQMLAMKIFDEKRSEDYKKYLELYRTPDESKKVRLMFYIDNDEKNYAKLSDKTIQEFIQRMKQLYEDASNSYAFLIDSNSINWKFDKHIEIISAMVENLQDYSFIRSYKTDLYQLVFYRFANEFAKEKKGQFITPLQIIDFLVKIVNPRNGESIIDPTCGVSDFLSLSYVNANGSLDDKNIYGTDIDDHMIMLSQINMLLNGDGNATIRLAEGHGSLLYKFNTKKELFALDAKVNKKGMWDEQSDTNNKLMKFNVVLTNPPFGENRKFQPKNSRDIEIAELYELWETARTTDWIDMGLLFLENAYRILGENGRLGIVLSNSIASVDRWERAREWLMNNMRIVALFDLPKNVFADSGVNTTLIIAYKPSKKELEKLKADNYDIFVRDIKNIGYEIRTLNRIKFYNYIYKINDKTFEVEIDSEGRPLYDEDFTSTVKEFRDWANLQEKTLRDLFTGE